MSDDYQAFVWQEHFASRTAAIAEKIEVGVQARDTPGLLEVRDQLRSLLQIDPGARKTLINSLHALVIVDSAHALKYLEEALALDDKDAGVLNNMAFMQQKQRGDYEKAAEFYRRCMDYHPDFVQAYLGLADVYGGCAAHHMQYNLLKTAVDRFPADARSLLAFGRAAGRIAEVGTTEEAVEALQKCISLNPEPTVTSAAKTGLAEVAIRAGDAAPGEAYLDEALVAHPGNVRAALNLVNLLCKESSEGAAERISKAMSDAIEAVGREGRGGLPEGPVRNSDPSHQPRVGFLWNSDVPACFTTWLFERLRWDVFIYSTDRKAPGMGKWKLRSVRDISAAAAAQVMRLDAIDVLVDLIGCAPSARPDIFAMRPATSMRTCDFLSADLHIPSVVPMPMGFCFAGPASNSPALGSYIKKGQLSGPTTLGYIGCLSYLSRACLASWSAALREFPEARLVIMSVVFNETSVRERFLEKRWPPDVRKRVLCLATKDDPESRMKTYRIFDAYLAPWPACPWENVAEALCMNVPIITEKPDAVTQLPCAADILEQCGMGEFCIARAERPIAVLARAIRRSVAGVEPRKCFLTSPFVDQDAFLNNFEDELMQGWVCSS